MDQRIDNLAEAVKALAEALYLRGIIGDLTMSHIQDQIDGAKALDSTPISDLYAASLNNHPIIPTDDFSESIRRDKQATFLHLFAPPSVTASASPAGTDRSAEPAGTFPDQSADCP